jgi:hypothetical protein
VATKSLITTLVAALLALSLVAPVAATQFDCYLLTSNDGTTTLGMTRVYDDNGTRIGTIFRSKSETIIYKGALHDPNKTRTVITGNHVVVYGLDKNGGYTKVIAKGKVK